MQQFMGTMLLGLSAGEEDNKQPPAVDTKPKSQSFTDNNLSFKLHVPSVAAVPAVAQPT